LAKGQKAITFKKVENGNPMTLPQGDPWEGVKKKGISRKKKKKEYKGQEWSPASQDGGEVKEGTARKRKIGEKLTGRYET